MGKRNVNLFSCDPRQRMMFHRITSRNSTGKPTRFRDMGKRDKTGLTLFYAHLAYIKQNLETRRREQVFSATSQFHNSLQFSLSFLEFLAPPMQLNHKNQSKFSILSIINAKDAYFTSLISRFPIFLLTSAFQVYKFTLAKEILPKQGRQSTLQILVSNL